jgi:alkyldihydroxyacetonephosphate synthase
MAEPKEQPAAASITALEDLFRRVATLVRESTSQTDSQGNSNAPSIIDPSDEEKLCLYGLYRFVRDGPCGSCQKNNVVPPVWQPVARAKYMAWNECSTRISNRHEAMTKYIEMVASRHDQLGNECQKLWEDFQQYNCKSSASPQEISRDLCRDSVVPSSCDDNVGEKVEETSELREFATPDIDASPTRKNGFGSTCLRYFGGRPLIPRGRLDISYADLRFAFLHCQIWKSQQSKLEHDRLKRHICDIWNQSSKDSADTIVVGFSVRSLFDLYLTMKVYPEESEILVVPPISVPGMMHVAKYHNLRIVPVDIDEQGGNWIDMDGIRSKITTRTVAIMVVHPFGMVTINDNMYAQLRSMADEHGLEIWEDCAECFTGLGKGGLEFCERCYLGNRRYADIRFFSFGNIKTATALGGGIAILRDPQHARQMERLQTSLYPTQQTSFEFFYRLVTVLCLNFIADSPVRVGLLALACRSCGVSFDTLVTYAVRGFRISSTKDEQKDIHKLIRQIRKRPSNTLLALLLRRLEQSASVAPSVPDRIRRCRLLQSLLVKHLSGAILRDLKTFQDTFWTFPICCKERNRISDTMKMLGFDVATGSSQLCSVSKFANGTDGKRSCPFTDKLMDSTLYLPLPMTDSTLMELVKALQFATKNGSSLMSDASNNRASFRNRWRPFAITAVIFALGLPISFIFWVKLGISLLLMRLTAEAILQWTTSEFYLKESSAFIENCDMLVAKPEGGDHHKVLSSIDALKLSVCKGDVGRSVVITGATGFVGSALLRDLLQHRDVLSLKRVFIVCRKKGGLAPQDRISKLMSSSLFDFLPQDLKEIMIHVVEGDVTEENIGLSPIDLSALVLDSSISHVFHCAASVSFTQELPESARSNITSALNMQALTERLTSRNVQFIHISTSFVHGNLTGSLEDPLPEKLFCFGPFDPVEIYKSMLSTQYYASRAMEELGFHNTYAFSKSVCEHLLVNRSLVKTLIIRPCIVGPAVESPFEGWAGDKPSTIVAGPCLHLSHQWNIWFLGRQRVSCIPVDVLARYILAKSFDGRTTTELTGNDAESSDDSFEDVCQLSDQSSDCEDLSSAASSSGGNCRQHQIFNAAWSGGENESASFSWLEFGVAHLHLGVALRYFSRSSAQLQLLVSAQLIPKLLPTNGKLFHLLHNVLIRFPHEWYRSTCDYVGLPCHRVTKLLMFLDLPLLFFPFVRSDFFFATDIVAPECFDAQRYSLSCGVAAHWFVSSNREESMEPLRNMSSLCIGGANFHHGMSLFWWAFLQPKGSFLMRTVAALFGMLLEKIASAVTVDVVSFRNHMRDARKRGRAVTLVLAPTHRSFLDFVLLSFIFFSLPELQIDIPFIIASNEFERLPLIGWLASLLRAFYIQRGRGSVDRSLANRLGDLKNRHSDAVIEVFIEGKRSRDRRFVKPKTGLLKSLKEAGGDYIIIPIAISYERVPEQEILSTEVTGASRRDLNLSGMIQWLFHAMKGNVNIGKIHIAANDTIALTCDADTDFDKLVKEIQIKQQERVVVSDYHIIAAEKLFGISRKEMKSTMEGLGCKFWPDIRITSLPEVPNDTSSLLSIVLQLGHSLAGLVVEDQKGLASWLDCVTGEDVTRPCILNSSTETLRKTLLHLFDLAGSIVDQSIHKLKENGFEDLSLDHVFQTCRNMNITDVPLPILFAVASMKLSIDVIDMDEQGHHFQKLYHEKCCGNEKLGFWGFRDSGFIARTDDGGRRYVIMKGKRYAICGKKLTKLLPFIETVLEVKIDLSKEFGLSLEGGPSKDSDLSLVDQKSLFLMFGKRVSFSPVERTRHGSGHSQDDVFLIRSGEGIRIPDAVVWPVSEEEAIALVDAARRFGWCLFPYGGGTNVTSATRCPSKAIELRPIISVDMGQMARILWLNEEDGLAQVEAGITGRDLVEKLRDRGYTMGHEPDSIEFSTLGGWIATKASGMKRSKYGNIEDIVLSTRMIGSHGVLWKGDGIDGRIAAGRDSEGVDVRSFALGSEGCLGIITSAVIRVWPLPDLKEYNSVLFPTFQDGLQFLRALSKQQSLLPACVRLLDNAHFRLGQALRPEDGSWFRTIQDVMTNVVAKSLLGERFDPDSTVCAIFCYEGSTGEVKEQMRGVKTLSLQYGGCMLGPDVGKAGYELTYMVAYLRDFAITYHILGESFETFVPWSKIEVVIAATKTRITAEHSARFLPGVPFVGCRVTQLYHEGTCLYFYLCMSFEGVKNASHVFAELERAGREEILKQGGSLSHHHGLGKLRSSFVKDRTSPGFRNATAGIKKAVDKDNIFGARNGLFASID